MMCDNIAAILSDQLPQFLSAPIVLKNPSC